MWTGKRISTVIALLTSKTTTLYSRETDSSRDL